MRMKQWIATALALMTLMPTVGYAKEAYINIQELGEQSQSGWKQTYKTKWRTVEIDAKVLVPQIEKMPVLLVADGVQRPLVTTQAWKESGEQPFQAGWYNDMPTYPRKQDGKRLNKDTEPKEVYSSGFAPENTYVPMSDRTFGEICDRVENAITQAGYDASTFTFRNPTRLDSSHMFYYGYKKDALPGDMSFQFRSLLNDTPVLSHIYMAVIDHYNGESREGEMLEIPRSQASYSAYDDKIYTLSLWLAKPVETIAEDVPLCSFDQVIAAIQPEIMDGHIRKIYEVELGYVLYNEPGVYYSRKTQMVEGRNTKEEMEADSIQRTKEHAAARYYARPMWQINCLWVKSPSGKLRETASYTTDERNTLDYYQLLVDAQTGELIQESTAYDRCEYKGFLSWENVSKK
ncbi:MAG: hypothetical protein RR065_03980 [Clostridia bacterium]